MKGYYVTCKDGSRTAWLRGPFETHQEALDLVNETRDSLVERMPFAWFYAFGTSSITSDQPLPQGKLNPQSSQSDKRR